MGSNILTLSLEQQTRQMDKESSREKFLELYQQLQQNVNIRKRIEKMISYREKKIADVELAMEVKVSIMKESNVRAINQFMKKQLQKEAKKWIANCDLSMLMGLD